MERIGMTGTAALAAALALGIAPSAVAADYPYSGYFRAADEGYSAEDNALLCAYGFFRQDRDGSYVNYHLDLPRYALDRTIRYVRYSSGACRQGENDVRIEVCTTDFSTDPSEVGAVEIDVLETVEPSQVAVVYFDTVADATAALAGDVPMPGSELFVRCDEMDDALLAGHLSEEVSTLPLAELDALLYPELDTLTRAGLEAIFDQLQRSP